MGHLGCRPQKLFITNTSHVPDSPLVSGTHQGGTVSVPMTGWTPLDPIDLVARATRSSRALPTEFGAFLVTLP
jgi:hypothetical protein